MASAHRFLGTVAKSEIKEPLSIIEGSLTDYITHSGTVYKLTSNGKYYKKRHYVNKYNGYVYIGITFHCKDGYPTNKNRRQHVLIAKAFIPRVQGCSIVGHLDNNKQNNAIDNLYWTTNKENSQKAYDDGLSVNDIGVEDSQSMPIGVYMADGTLVAVYGSIAEAGRFIEGTSSSSICKVVDNGATSSVKGFIYKTITEEFYRSRDDIQFLNLKTKYIEKVRTNIKVTSPTGEVCIFDSQKSAGASVGIPQGSISHILGKGGEYKGWTFSRTTQECSLREVKWGNLPDLTKINPLTKKGNIFQSNNWGDMMILEYKNSLEIKIKFLNTGNERWVKSQAIRTGKVADLALKESLS